MKTHGTEANAVLDAVIRIALPRGASRETSIASMKLMTGEAIVAAVEHYGRTGTSIHGGPIRDSSPLSPADGN